MPDKYRLLRCTTIAALSWGIGAKPMCSAELAGIEQTLRAIQDCMVRSPAPWADEWKREYIETIRNAISPYQDDPEYNTKLEILHRGFELYWESFKKANDRSLFEVHRARIRWYVEYLMETEFPTEQERQELRDQFTDIWDYAANSLLTQFPFLDPNAAQKAKQEDLSVCYRKIDAPLMPVYLRPFSEEHVEQIKQRWDDLRYARVDLWRKLSGNSTMPLRDNEMASSNAKRDYQLTQKSLSQLLAQIWMVVPQRPDYYLDAMENQTAELKHHVQVKRQAQSDQQRLEKERSRQLLQTEHIGFLMTALLETALRLEGPPHVIR